MLSYVARYRRGEQKYSRSQNELSTFTVSITLNQPGMDFQVMLSTVFQFFVEEFISLLINSYSFMHSCYVHYDLI